MKTETLRNFQPSHTNYVCISQSILIPLKSFYIYLLISKSFSSMLNLFRIKKLMWNIDSTPHRTVTMQYFSGTTRERHRLFQFLSEWLRLCSPEPCVIWSIFMLCNSFFFSFPLSSVDKTVTVYDAVSAFYTAQNIHYIQNIYFIHQNFVCFQNNAVLLYTLNQHER